MTTMIPNLFLLVKMNHIHLLARANLILKPFFLCQSKTILWWLSFGLYPFMTENGRDLIFSCESTEL